MQKCSSCGDDLPENSRFCGKCGKVQGAIATDASATRSHTPPPPSWVSEGGTIPATWSPYSNDPAQGSAPAWSPNVQAPETPPPAAENEDERRRGIPPWSPLYGAALGGDVLPGSGQVYTPGAPFVQGTPQIGSVPGVAGSPTPYTNAPVSPPAQGPGNAPISHAMQGPGNAPYSQAGQQSTHNPPGQPGTQEHHLPHGPHRHHAHPTQHEPHRHHDHPAQHEPHQHRTHRAQHEHHTAHVTKAAGGSAVKTIIIVATAVVVVAAGGIAAAAHFLSHPQPLISITSNYKMGNALAGANGTILHISGQQFSSNAAITFLLDGHVAPGNPGTRSDSNGNFSAAMTITGAWSVGTHILTARDASNYSTKNSVSVMIVQQGQANTPGPDGAPPDDASFKVIARIQAQATAGNPYSTQETEVVTGHPDPMGGTVCQPEDNGQPIVITGFTIPASVPYQERSTYSCAGSYKGGKLTLTEMFTSDVVVYSEPNGTIVTCTLNKPPQIGEQVSGSYTGNNTFSGTITYPALPGSDYSCNNSYSYGSYAKTYEQDKWTGQVTGLHS